MPVAFTLVDAELGKIDGVLHEILQVEEVEEAYSVAGPYAILAKVEAKEFEELTEVIPENICGIDGVEDTLTLVAFGVSKEFRREACEEAKKLAEQGDMEGLYELCRNCEKLKFCSYGARVITYGF